jgi:hypothetical protein
MANWTVSSYSNTETYGDNVNAGSMAAYADLTITPNAGYVISATDFKIGGATESPTNTWTGGNVDAEVYKVVFSDDPAFGAGTVGNTVKARVHFAEATGTGGPGGTSWSMPPNDDTIYIDIDEKDDSVIDGLDRIACVTSAYYSLTDAIDQTVTYATAPVGITTTETTTSSLRAALHSGTVPEGVAYPGSQIFQVTFAANTIYNYYYQAPPTFIFSLGVYASYYQMVDSNSIFTNGNLTSITYTLYYMPPVTLPLSAQDSQICQSNHKVVFNTNLQQTAAGNPGTTPLITSVSTSEEFIPSTGILRNIKVFGDAAAIFKLVLTRTADGHTYDFSTDLFTSGATTSTETTVGSSGVQSFDVTIPSVSSAATYDITIVPTSPTSTSVGVPLVANDLRWYQYASIVASLGFDDPDGVWGEAAASGDIFHSSENTKITLSDEAGSDLGVTRAFSYTIKPAMLDAGSGTLAPKSSLDFILSNQGSVGTLVDGNITSATFDVDSTVGIGVGSTINWSINKTPLFTEENVSDIQIGTVGVASIEIPVNLDNLAVGMILTASNIRSSSKVTIETINDNSISLSEAISTSTKTDITFTADGVTVSSITDANTLVASQSLSGLKDNLSLDFGGGTSDVSAYVTNGTVTQSSANVIIAGNFALNSIGTAAVNTNLDIKELITIS